MQLPGMLQTSGWVPAIALIIIIALFTAKTSVYLADAMASVKGNQHYGKRLEFGKLALLTLPRWAYYAAVLTLIFVFFTNNLANIVMSAQVRS